MENYIYEVHTMQEPLLPFIYHKEFTVVQRHCPPNMHQNMELLYCLSGQGEIQCGTENAVFVPGDLYIVNSDLSHCVCSDTTVVYRCLIIDNSFLRDNGIEPPVYFQRMIRDARFRELLEQLDDAFDLHAAGRPYAVLAIRRTVLSLLQILCSEYVADTPPEADTAAYDNVKKALFYIKQNMTATITLDAVAKYVGVNKYYLSRSFKAITGMTIIETVNLVRCTEARRLIDSGMQVGNAAAACGYENLSYFTRTFRKIFGKLPSAFSVRKNSTAGERKR